MTEPGCTVNLDELTRPFKTESIRYRDGGGGKRLAYLDGATVIRRLNEATGNNWTFVVVSEDERMRGNTVLLIAHGQLTIPGLGTREAVGVQEVQERSGVDFYKGHYTDALKKCASLFGVGLELYGEDHEYGDEPSAPSPPLRQMGQYPPPPPPAEKQAARGAPTYAHEFAFHNQMIELTTAARERGVPINSPNGDPRLTWEQIIEIIARSGGPKAPVAKDGRVSPRAVWDALNAMPVRTRPVSADDPIRDDEIVVEGAAE